MEKPIVSAAVSEPMLKFLQARAGKLGLSMFETIRDLIKQAMQS